ncbi:MULTISPECIES: TIGR01777 family oxidoreductase [Vibrio]|uniref:TIGR01777 family protein n=1 Tax=Vibrio algicola TaxID=2662262 RepID=A0A5Q0TJT1_9VIBR|nr:MULTISPECIES: TIGR01777 family oxidoreductase [Vibrio]MBD1575881.1 TIGR01777 family protein [Vibrio sp. S11_S32]
MHILLTGGTGFIGSELIKHLVDHHITVLTRSSDQAKSKLKHADFSNIDYVSCLSTWHNLDHIDAIINLAGEPIATKRWTESQKQKICHSRWDITQQIVSLIKASQHPPHTLISGSAVGYYGDQKQHVVMENTPPIVINHSFAHHVCQQWENIAMQASSTKTRVCIIRTGIVLGSQGGALLAMLPPFRFGVGGKLGRGNQYMPWIHIQDEVRAITYLLQQSQTSGTFNLCAPHPVPNKHFSRLLAKTLRRPCLISTPQWVFKLIMGESRAILFDSVRAKPKHLTEIGFIFTYSRLEPALKQLLQSTGSR